MLSNKRRAAAGISKGSKSTRKAAGRRNIAPQKTLLRRKPVARKRFAQKDNERAELGQTFNDGYNTGFAKGFEDGHQAAYEKRQ
ncbi:flagellar biosynthesis/type III secretory pathway protein FliH [Paenibacillus endophyticus]|uniref:Flagellar biosynthesis/type III secretory pathway protein FliH n=1 Tax=Paenibacillus endophyticus TaxID=1294268 RepID=A0A7W5GCM2_9BACL|nr:hypothetical protein [Paenibacillus endophyticus]MBB3154975.1 flagellar biosynthesis/type III secretory pathway protein FliH [Paenibacillus endophyticus]